MSGLPSTTPRDRAQRVRRDDDLEEHRNASSGCAPSFTAEQAAEILEAEAEEVAAEVNAAATQQLAQGDGDGSDDDDDAGADADAALRAYRAARIAELKAARAGAPSWCR